MGILLLLLLCPSRGISRRKGRRILFFLGGVRLSTNNDNLSIMLVVVVVVVVSISL